MNRKDLLREANKAAMTCLESLRAISYVNRDSQFSTVLLEQEKLYSDYAAKIRRIADQEGVELEDEGFLPKMMLWGMTKMKTLGNKSPSKLSEMLTQGIDMGIISIDKINNEMEEGTDRSLADELKNYYNATKEAVRSYL
jgi:hypothetical protein